MPLHRLNRRTLLKAGLAAGGIARMALSQEENSSKKTTSSALALARVVNAPISYATLPPLPIQYAKMILASTLSGAAAGAKIGSARIIRELAKEQGGRAEATVWFDGA